MHLLCITTYNSANPNLRELIFKHWSYLGRSSATRELGRQDIMVTCRKPSSLKDMLVRAKIPQPKNTTCKGCTRPNTCQYCTRISQSRKITNINNNTTYNTITKGTCQSNNLIYCLEYNWCQIKYVSQTKTESLIDSKVTYLTSNTITKLQWLDIFIVTIIRPILV